MPGLLEGGDLGTPFRRQQARLGPTLQILDPLRLGLEREPLLDHCRIGIVALLAFVDSGKHGLQGVVVNLSYRIEFVVVTAGTVDGQPGEGRHGRRDDIVAIEVAGDLAIEGIPRCDGRAQSALVPRAGGEETGGDDRLRIVGEKNVAGDLLTDEAGIRLVGVEGADQVIAIGPGVGPEAVLIMAVRVGIVGDVEPMAGPAFAVARRGEQAVHQPLVGVGRWIVEERIEFRRRRRQAGQVDADPREQARRSASSEGEGFIRSSQFVEHEGIDRIDPGGVVGGRGRNCQALEGSEGPAVTLVDRLFRVGRAGQHVFWAIHCRSLSI